MINLFVGFDTREIVAHHVCINSIIRQSTQPLSITPLALNNLGQYSESHLDGSNQFNLIDILDKSKTNVIFGSSHT